MTADTRNPATGRSYVLRSIKNYSRVFDVSVCSFPAAEGTSVSSRALEARSAAASRAGVISEAERLKLLDRANRKRLSWVTREIAKEVDDPEADDDFDPEDGYRCVRCGGQSFRCTNCGQDVVQKTDTED